MTELRDAMRRLFAAAVPATPTEPHATPPEMVLVQRTDLRAVLQLVKRLKNRTPADSCVVCRHKDREHYSTGCHAHNLDTDGARCGCDEFVSVDDVPFDRRGSTAARDEEEGNPTRG